MTTMGSRGGQQGYGINQARPNLLMAIDTPIDERLRGSGYSSAADSPDRMVTDDLDDNDNDFYQQPISNDSKTSIVDDDGLSGFREMSVSRTRNSPAFLPPELLFAIFGRLSSPHDLRNCMVVCKNWARCAVELLWLRPYVLKWSSLQHLVHTIQQENTLFHYASLIRRLNLTSLAEELNDGTMQPLEICTRLERLTLTNCTMVTDGGLMGVLSNNPRLMALDLSGLPDVTDNSLRIIALNCPRLQGLNITGCEKVTDESMVAIAERCTQLKRLKLNDCKLLTDESVTAFTKHCPHLLEIDLHKVEYVTDNSIVEVFRNLKYLRELRLAHCRNLEDGAFTRIPPRALFDCLRILDLTNCVMITDASVEVITNAAPRLRNLVLAKCAQITDRSVESISRLGKNLHYLHLGHCANLTDKAIQLLIKSCNRIRYIDLACCTRLTDVSICELATLPKLRRIGLVKCSQITDKAILALVQTNRSQPCALERVHLSYCSLLTITGVQQLVNACTRLTHLSLTGVACFLRKDLTRYCRLPPSDFNLHQRTVFCVFSGPGVAKLRGHLNYLFTLGNPSEEVFYEEDPEDENGEPEDDDDDEEEEAQED